MPPNPISLRCLILVARKLYLAEFVDAQSQIDEKQAALELLLEQAEKDALLLGNLRSKKDSLWTRFVDNCWESKGKGYKGIFGGAGDFSTKEKFVKKVMATSPVQHSLADLKKRYETVTDSTAKKYAPFAPLDLSHLDAVEGFQLLGESIVSTADNRFNRFMQTLEAVAWVKQGYEQYSPKADGKCPYCQQDLGADFKKEIAECFDSKYSDDCKKVTAFQARYAEYTTAFVSTIKQYTESLKGFAHKFGNVIEFEKYLALLEKAVSENNQRIAAKAANPSETPSLDSIRPFLEALNNLTAEANGQIAKHNAILDNRLREQSACMAAVWELLAYELKTAVHQYGVDDRDLDSKISAQKMLVQGQQEPITLLKAQISHLTKKTGRFGGNHTASKRFIEADGISRLFPCRAQNRSRQISGCP
jgi:wobble nucleotide-excising tRNase